VGIQGIQRHGEAFAILPRALKQDIHIVRHLTAAMKRGCDPSNHQEVHSTLSEHE